MRAGGRLLLNPDLPVKDEALRPCTLLAEALGVGLTVEEVAHMLGVSKRKVEGEWTHAKAWLKNRLSETAVR